jgi:hypothetical protein
MLESMFKATVDWLEMSKTPPVFAAFMLMAIAMWRIRCELK